MFVISTKNSIFAARISDCRKASVCFLILHNGITPLSPKCKAQLKPSGSNRNQEQAALQ